MLYEETKVYYDGSHYIAIPHTENKTKRRPPPEEEYIAVKGRNSASTAEETATKVTDERGMPKAKENAPPKEESKITKKELFNELYNEHMGLKKSERRKKIAEAMLPYFDTETACKRYVDMNFERKQRNLIARRVRMCRKANLARFNYFCTFTYDDGKHTEESFRKKLKNTLAHLSNRKGWRYIGVWERSPKKKRLHFHGLFEIPDGTMPGELIQKRDYSFITHEMQTTHQNTYFNERFGRSDFEKTENNDLLGSALAYLLKYIGKSGEKIVYSKGLPQFFITDITDDDVVCRIGQEDKKLLLYDDFKCWDEGVYMGKVSPDTIKRMRKSN